MRRRTVLIGLGGALTGASGCAGPSEESSTPTRGTTTTAGGTATPTRQRTTAATPQPSRTPVGAVPCPPFEGLRDRVVCSQGPSDGPVGITVDPARATVSDGSLAEDVSITLSNRSDRRLAFNPGSWRLYRLTTGGWRELEAEIAVDGRLTVEPGGSWTYSLTQVADSVRIDMAFTPATYAAVLAVPAPGGDEWIDCVAVVTLDDAGGG